MADVSGVASRIDQFLAWVTAQGEDRGQLPELRRVAGMLYARAGSRAVAEADVHALRELRPAEAALIDQVGDLLLRFQSTGRAAPARAAGARLPSGAGASPTPLVGQFRCPECRVMVTLTADEGICPQCGREPPRLIESVVAAPSSTPPRPRWIVPSLAAVALAVLAVQHGPRALDRLRHPSADVSAGYRSPLHALSLEFPDGWRHLREADAIAPAALDGTPFAALIDDPLGVRRARFFRGSLSTERTAELVVVTGPRRPTATDLTIEEWHRGVAAAPAELTAAIRGVTGVADVVLERCVPVLLGARTTLRCTGEASGDARNWSALAYVWAGPTAVVLALLASSEHPETAAMEGDFVVDSAAFGPPVVAGVP